MDRILILSLFLRGCRSLIVVAPVAACVALSNACGLTSKSTEIVELCSPDATSFYQIDVVDNGRVQWKDSLNADAKTRLSHGDGFTRAAMFASDHDALKSLQSLFRLRFLNPHVNTDRIAGLKLWDITAQLSLFNIVQSIHFSMLLINLFSRSGRLRRVFSIAACLRQRSISA